MKKARVAVDFDGVIYSYKSGYIEGELPDPPVLGAFEFLYSVIDSGYDVTIFSTRCKSNATVMLMKDWMIRYGMKNEYIEMMEFTNIKPIAKIYLDDRAISFNGYFPTIQEIDNFEPWHKGKSSSVKEYNEKIVIDIDSCDENEPSSTIPAPFIPAPVGSSPIDPLSKLGQYFALRDQLVRVRNEKDHGEDIEESEAEIELLNRLDQLWLSMSYEEKERIKF